MTILHPSQRTLAINLPNVALTIALSIDGPLSDEVVATSIAMLEERHDALRMRLVSTNGEGAQEYSAPRSRFPILVNEFSDDEEFRDLLGKLSSIPIDLYSEGPLRCLLARSQPNRSIVVLWIHHVATDAWSNKIIESELIELLYGVAAGETPDMSSPGSYIGAISRAVPDAAGLSEDQLTYWSGVLANRSVLMEFAPVADPGSELDPVEYRNHELKSALANTGRHFRVLNFAIVLAAFSLALSKLLDDNDVVFTYVDLGRRTRDDLATVGCFMRSVPICLSVDEDSAWSDYVVYVMKAYLENSQMALPYWTAGRLTTELMRNRQIGLLREGVDLASQVAFSLNVLPEMTSALAGASQEPTPVIAGDLSSSLRIAPVETPLPLQPSSRSEIRLAMVYFHVDEGIVSIAPDPHAMDRSSADRLIRVFSSVLEIVTGLRDLAIPEAELVLGDILQWLD
jgi:hypothetical protein